MDFNIYLIVKRLSYAVCIGMFIVVLNGTLVTKTGSGSGCGTDWPLCNGKFVPAYTLESMIEYSHRSVTGVVGLLVLALFLYVICYARHHREAVCYSSLTLLFTLIQAIMGALVVLFTQPAPVMALHFGISLLAFASSCMMCVAARRYECEALPVRTSAARVIRSGFRYGIWFTLFYTYIVIYIGAFVRHTKSSGACIGWPLCNGKWIPDRLGETSIPFIHRVAAALLFLLVGIIVYYAYAHYKENREIQLCSIWTFVLCVLQIASGALVVNTLMRPDWFLLASLTHAVLICGLFSMLCYLSIRVWQLRRN